MVTIGLAKDSEINLKSLPISIFKLGKIYIPQDDYVSSDPLPDIWMEIFEDEYKSNLKETIHDSDAEMALAYTPRVP